MQSAPTDKLLKPPRGGGKSKEKSGFRSAERCLRSLSRRMPAIQMKFSKEEMVFISKSDRLLTASGYEKNSAPLLRALRRILPITCYLLP